MLQRIHPARTWQTGRTKIICALAVGISLLSGCTRPLDRDDLAGSYILNRSSNVDGLTLLPDGSYVHETVVNGSPVREMGTWEVETEAQRVVLANFVHRWRPPTQYLPAVASYWPADVERSRSGRVRLLVNEDLGLYYEKQ